MRVIVMGGRSGIGLATAAKLTADGAEVVVTGRNAERLAAAKDRVSSGEPVDGSSNGDVTAFFAQDGPFDHLVLAFSARGVGPKPVHELTPADVRAAFEGKLFAYLFAIQHAQVTGSITMISAASARAGLPTSSALPRSTAPSNVWWRRLPPS